MYDLLTWFEINDRIASACNFCISIQHYIFTYACIILYIGTPDIGKNDVICRVHINLAKLMGIGLNCKSFLS